MKWFRRASISFALTGELFDPAGSNVSRGSGVVFTLNYEFLLTCSVGAALAGGGCDVPERRFCSSETCLVKDAGTAGVSSDARPQVDSQRSAPSSSETDASSDTGLGARSSTEGKRADSGTSYSLDSGAACQMSQCVECDGGGCADECDPGEIRCGVHCVDPMSDPADCGVSPTCQGGNRCAEGVACVSGECITPCPESGYVRCDGDCIDPSSDSRYCGAGSTCLEDERGMACNEQERCVASVCRAWRRTTVIAKADSSYAPVALFVTEASDAVVFFRGLDEEIKTWVYLGSTSEWSPIEPVAGAEHHVMGGFGDGPSSSSFVVVLVSADRGLLFRRWEGAGWGDIRTIANDVSFPAMAGHRAGHGIVSWVSGDQVRAATWHSSTLSWSAETPTTSEARLVLPVPAIGPGGASFVVWLEEGPDSADYRVYASRSGGDGVWRPPIRVGDSKKRVNGYELVVTDSGSLVAYWAGRVEGILWDASQGAWVSMDAEGEWVDAKSCVLSGDEVMFAGMSRSVPGYVFGRRMSGERLFAAEPLHPDPEATAQPSPVLDCDASGAWAAWTSDGTLARRWDEARKRWSAPHHLGAGAVRAIAALPDGKALLARVVGEAGDATLVIEHFE